MKAAKRIVVWGALLTVVALFVACPPNELLTDVQQKVNSAKEGASAALTAFSIVSPSETGIIVGTTIAVTVPRGTTVTALVANFATTGVSVKVGSMVQISGVTANNFTNPVTYTVVAADGSTQTYTVTVTVAYFTNYTTANGFGSNAVNAVAVSGSYIYAATGNGLSISINGGTTWQTYTTSNGLPSNYIHGVTVSGTTIYAATDAGLSVSTNPSGTWATSLSGTSVYGVVVSGSTIYAATSAGLSVYNSSSWTTYSTANSNLPDNEVYGVAVSGTTIYVATGFGTAGGVSVSTTGGSSWTNYTTTNGLGSNFVFGVTVSGNTIYAATEGGLSVSNNGGSSWTTYTTANGLGNNATYDAAFFIFSNSNGFPTGSIIYVATAGGLSYSTNGSSSWTTYSTANGLASNTVNAVALNVTGTNSYTLYVATNGGLSVH